jgi:hypothetical protein
MMISTSRLRLTLIVISWYIALTVACKSVEAGELYFYVGTGYVVNEQEWSVVEEDFKNISGSTGHPLVAHFELGYEWESGWKAGILHESRWFSDAPLNNDKEYIKDEVFIGYKFGGIK